MLIGRLLIAAVLGYLIGSFPTGLLLTRLLGKRDIRMTGSGHTGGLNVSRSAGFVWGAFTGLADAGKGVLAAWLALRLTGTPWALPAAGMGAVVGHCWSAYIGFAGAPRRGAVGPGRPAAARQSARGDGYDGRDGAHLLGLGPAGPSISLCHGAGHRRRGDYLRSKPDATAPLRPPRAGGLARALPPRSRPVRAETGAASAKQRSEVAPGRGAGRHAWVTPQRYFDHAPDRKGSAQPRTPAWRRETAPGIT
jgi:hypothetical protein